MQVLCLFLLFHHCKDIKDTLAKSTVFQCIPLLKCTELMLFIYSYVPINVHCLFLTTKDKQMDLMKHIYLQLSILISQNTCCYLGYFHIPANLYQIFRLQNKRKLIAYMCLWSTRVSQTLRNKYSMYTYVPDFPFLGFP